MPSRPFRLASVATFNGIDADGLALLETRLEAIDVARGQAIVTEGEAADSLYVVVSGRFAVEVGGDPEPITEIGKGGTIGEIAFLAGGARTATVRAIRDSVVVRLSRADFDAITTQAPQIWNTVAATLATRLAAETRKTAVLRATALNQPRARPAARTIAIVPAGPSHIQKRFIALLSAEVRSDPQAAVLTASDVETGASASVLEISDRLNELEAQFSRLVFIADPKLTPWTEAAIHQADAIVSVAEHPRGPLGSTVPLNAVEAFAAQLHRPAAHRLAIVHDGRGAVQGTRHWLAHRRPAMHHHIALDDNADVARLWRFMTGTARGFVACGGGAYCAAHIGVYKAFREAGVAFDLYGGTSGGAAMAAGFAQHVAPEDIDARVHRMFIEGKALARYTVPRYSLLDHHHFDRHLQTEYGNVLIEDIWLPYYAVSADLETAALEVHRDGPLWQAVRASAAIPGLLPPFASADGRMLVDGSVIANVPVDVMHVLKTGPNVIVSFEAPGGRREPYDYASLPERRDLVWSALNPFTRGLLSNTALPAAPSAATVLVRSLMANRSRFETQLGPDDRLLVPPTPEGMGALDWRRHSELVETAYRHTAAELAARSWP